MEVAYVPGSFVQGDFLPRLVPLVSQLPGQLTVGGTSLSGGSGASGPATLGSLRFRVQEGFDGQTEIVLTEVTLDRLDVEDEIRAVSALVALRSDAIELDLPGDFDGSAGVNLDDFFLCVDAFGTQDARFDLNGDGSVNFPDFFLFADFFDLAVQISP